LGGDDELFDEILGVESEYADGNLDRAGAIKLLRGLWGELGHSVDDENAGIYLDMRMKDMDERIFDDVLREGILADSLSGLPRARKLLEEALDTIGSAAQEIRDTEDYEKWNELGEIYAELKMFWGKL